MSQFDLFATAGQDSAIAHIPDPNAIRERLQAVLAQLRGADKMPWKAAELRSWRHVFHNMANWLPPEERDNLRREFTAELARLEEA